MKHWSDNNNKQKRYMKQIIPGFTSRSVIMTNKYKIYKQSGAVWTLDSKTQLCTLNENQMIYIITNRKKWYTIFYKKKLDNLLENYPESFNFLLVDTRN